jgi:fructose-1,6-bisphosphatase/inositol monophosphatase family enzyme
MSFSFVKHLQAMMLIGQRLVLESPDLGDETGEINTNGGMSLKMDVELEKVFLAYIKEHDLPVTIFSEERGFVRFHPNPEYLIAFDPLDGSANYKYGKGYQPFGTFFAVYEGLSPKLSDVIAASAIEYTQGNVWVYDGEVTRLISENEVTIKIPSWKVDSTTPFYLDLYWKAVWQTYFPVAEKLFFRNSGSTVGNLALTLLGTAAGLGGTHIKAEEIGAVYALLKGAGMKVVDHLGNSIDDVAFDQQMRCSVLAGDQKVVDFIANTIQEFC